MRISRSGSPAPFPPLDFLLPVEKSWALEAEREACLHGEDELLQSDISVGLRDSGSSSKRLHTGGDVHLRCSKREELTSCNSSKISDPKLHKSGWCAMCRYADSHVETNCMEGRNRALSFTSSSRCYPLNMQARGTNQFSRGTKPVRQAAHRSESRQECCSKWKKALEFEVHNDASMQAREDLAFLSEDISLFGKDRHARHSRQFPSIQNKGKRSYVEKTSFTGDCENEKSPSQYRSAIRKRYSNAAAYNGVGFSAKGDCENEKSPTQYRSAIRKRYNNAAAYNGVGFSAKEDDSSKDVSTCKPHMSESESNEELHLERVDQAVAKKQYEMLASLLLDVNSDSRRPEAKLSDGGILELPVSMDIDDGVEATRMVSTKVSCSRNNDLNNKMQRNESALYDSMKHNVRKSSCISPSPVSRSFPSVFVDVTNCFELHVSPGVKEEAEETDAHRLSQRQRQIEFGKNTLGYERYNELVPRLKRKARDPQTPNPKQICSKRSWDGQIRKWRRLLHVYDPPSEDGEEIAEDLSVLKLHTPKENHDAADAFADVQRICDSNGIGSKNADEGKIGKEDVGLIISEVGRKIEDDNLTIYDDWMES